jgi:hypothetical protein
VIKQLGHGTGRKETFCVGIISNSDMKFVKVMKKKKFPDGFIESVVVV